MTRFVLRFWVRRSDDDAGHPLVDVIAPPSFRFKETGETRNADGDAANKWAPWWDVGVEVTLEAESIEAAWSKVDGHFEVVERRSARPVEG